MNTNGPSISASKSVSVASLAGGDQRLIDAHDAAAQAALDALTRELDVDATREEVERQVADALAHDPAGEFAQHFLETLQAERDLAGGWAREPLPASATADQQQE